MTMNRVKLGNRYRNINERYFMLTNLVIDTIIHYKKSYNIFFKYKQKEKY